MTGRKALFLIIIGMTILFTVLFRTFGADATWRFWNIPAATPPFI